MVLATFLCIVAVGILVNDVGFRRSRYTPNDYSGSLSCTGKFGCCALIALPALTTFLICPAQLLFAGSTSPRWTPLEVKSYDGASLDVAALYPVDKGVSSRNKYLVIWGGNGMAYKEYELQMKFLAKKLRVNVVGVNIRGVGRHSSILGNFVLGRGVSSAKQLAKDGESVVLALEKTLGIKKKDLILYGHSLGGAIAARIPCDGCQIVLDRTFSSLSTVAKRSIIAFSVLVSCGYAAISYYYQKPRRMSNLLSWKAIYVILPYILFLSSVKSSSRWAEFVAGFALLLPSHYFAWVQIVDYVPAAFPFEERIFARRKPLWFAGSLLVLAFVALLINIPRLVLYFYGLELDTTNEVLRRLGEGSKVVVLHHEKDPVIRPDVSLVRGLTAAGTAMGRKNLQLLEIVEDLPDAHMSFTKSLLQKIVSAVHS